MGYSKYYAFQISGSIYLYEKLTETPLGLFLGGLVWEFTAILLGILTVFLMKFTGKDYWWLKGIAVSNTIMFTVIYGFLLTLGAAKIVPFDLPTNITMFIGNIIFGITMGYFIIRLGGEALPST